MRDQEVQEWMDSLYPIGGERWIKVKFCDQDKARRALSINHNPERLATQKEQFGFETTALGFSDEFTITMQSLFHLKNDLISQLYGRADERVVNLINRLFDEKAQELQRQHTITKMPNGLHE